VVKANGLDCHSRHELEGKGSETAQVSQLKLYVQRLTHITTGLILLARRSSSFGPSPLWQSYRLLEVGAVRPDNYRGCTSWLDVTAIDLHSRHPTILEQDFLLMDLDQHREAWDIMSLSLVLNFVPDGKDRGTFLHHPLPSFFLESIHGHAVRAPAKLLYCSTDGLNFIWFEPLIGRMLVHAHSMLRSGGLCFVAVRASHGSNGIFYLT
jgi:hypothetical protein